MTLLLINVLLLSTIPISGDVFGPRYSYYYERETQSSTPSTPSTLATTITSPKTSPTPTTSSYDPIVAEREKRRRKVVRQYRGGDYRNNRKR